MDLEEVREELSRAGEELAEVKEATFKAIDHLEGANMALIYLEDEENQEEREIILDDLEDNMEGLRYWMKRLK